MNKSRFKFKEKRCAGLDILFISKMRRCEHYGWLNTLMQYVSFIFKAGGPKRIRRSNNLWRARKSLKWTKACSFDWWNVKTKNTQLRQYCLCVFLKSSPGNKVSELCSANWHSLQYRNYEIYFLPYHVIKKVKKSVYSI